MSRSRTRPIVIVLLAAAACTHSVSRPSTPEQTTRRVAGWPNDLTGLVLRDGREIDLPRSAVVTVIGDSLIATQVTPVRGGPVHDTVRVADVTHVVVRRTHVGRTVAAGLLLVVAVVAILGEEDEPDPPPQTSCPILYAHNGSAYVAVAEPLGGAISSGLQRTDLSQLEGISPIDGEYHLIIANEMREAQYLDAFSLIVADHPEGTTVVADRAGNLNVVSALVAPLRAADAAGEDLLPLLIAHDQQWWSPGASPAPFVTGQLRDTITLSFPRPAQNQAGLVLHSRTSRLGAHALKAMLDLWGGEVDHWYGLLDGSPAARAAHQEWVEREELWVLRIWVREGTEWVAQDLAVGGGPYLSELQTMTLDLSGVQGETVELRLHPPRGYWDLDFAALDTTRLAPPAVTELQIAEADSLDGQDARGLLRAADGIPFVMSETGQHIGVTFTAPVPAEGMTRTVFSRSTGYYRVETDRTAQRQAARLDSLWLQRGYAVKLAEQFHAGRQSRAPH